MTERPVVTVFGASLTRRTDPEYAIAERLGSLLARSGYAVMTGGYFGMMEAVSKGAKLPFILYRYRGNINSLTKLSYR